jgi:hypothetical protein
MAAKAKASVDTFMTVSAVLEEHEANLSNARCAQEGERTAIKNYLESMNGKLTDDLPASEILAAAGVRKCLGTSSFASRELKRVLRLTQQK